MKTKLIILVAIVFFGPTAFSQSKGIRYQFANVSNVVAPNLAGNFSSTFEVGTGDVVVHTPYLTLSNQPNVGYSALSTFGPDLCYKGSKLIAYPPYVSGLFSDVVVKSNGGFATYTKTKPYIVRNYDSNSQLIYEAEISDSNTYSTATGVHPAKMFVHPMTNNLFFAYMEYANETNANIPGFVGSPIVNFVEISNANAQVVSSFKLQIPYDRMNPLLPWPAISTWAFFSEITDLQYVMGSIPEKDRIWMTIRMRHLGSYLLDAAYNITSNTAVGCYPDQNYTCVFSISPTEVNNPGYQSLIGLLPATSFPKIVPSTAINTSGYRQMMLSSVENQKPVIYRFPYLGFMDAIPATRYEFPITVSNGYSDIKNFQNNLLLSFDNYFGIFNPGNLQLNLRRRTSGFPIFSSSGSINYPVGDNSSLYLNFNMTTASGAPTNFLIKESLSDFSNTCFSANFSNLTASSQSVVQTPYSAIIGVLEPTSNIHVIPPQNYSYTDVTNHTIMTVYAQCNIGSCPAPVSKNKRMRAVEEADWELLPNPANSYFEISAHLSIEKVEIYSVSGQLIKSFPSQKEYLTSDLKSGTYLVRVNTPETVLSKILIVK